VLPRTVNSQQSIAFIHKMLHTQKFMVPEVGHSSSINPVLTPVLFLKCSANGSNTFVLDLFPNNVGNSHCPNMNCLQNFRQIDTRLVARSIIDRVPDDHRHQSRDPFWTVRSVRANLRRNMVSAFVHAVWDAANGSSRNSHCPKYELSAMTSDW